MDYTLPPLAYNLSDAASLGISSNGKYGNPLHLAPQCTKVSTSSYLCYIH